jgi:rhomboid protease GluP
MVIIYTAGGITGFIFSTLSAFLRLLPLPIAIGNVGTTVGASAPLFGLLAALIYYGRRGGSSMISNQAKSWALMLAFFGFFVPGVDNFAHAGGFVGGYIASKLLDPLKPERLDHMIVALLCLLATGIAIVYSIAKGLPLINA